MIAAAAVYAIFLTSVSPGVDGTVMLKQSRYDDQTFAGPIECWDALRQIPDLQLTGECDPVVAGDEPYVTDGNR